MSLIAVVFVLRKSMICKRWNIPLLCSGVESSEESMPTMPMPVEQLEGMNDYPLELEEELPPAPAGEMMQGGDIPPSTAAMAVRLGGMGY